MEIKQRFNRIQREIKEAEKLVNHLAYEKTNLPTKKLINQIFDESKSDLKRSFHSVKLIAVSKNFSSQMIRQVYSLGQIDFAENYANEFLDKFNELKDLNIRWHFIGHLQTNKVCKVVGAAHLIHSVDSESLLKKIILQSVKLNIQQRLLLQIKFGSEDTKYGFDLSEIDSIIESYKLNPAIMICGFMCILPLGISEAEKLKYFISLKEKLISVKIQLKLPDSFKELSMGMSDDFKLAISAGSTMIRIGTAIFGVRS